MDGTRLLVTIATQRTGTKALGSAMADGEAIHSLGELFTPLLPPPPRTLFRRLNEELCHRPNLRYTRVELFDVLDHVFSQYLDESPRPIFHFDVMYNQLGFLSPLWEPVLEAGARSTLLSYLVARQIPVIHLRRSVEDCVRSEIVMALSGVAHTDAAGTTHVAPTFQPWGKEDTPAARAAWTSKRVSQITFWRHLVHAELSAIPHLDLEYRDAFDGPTVSRAAIDGVRDLLRLDDDDRLSGLRLFGASRFIKNPQSAAPDIEIPTSAATEWSW